MITYQNVQSHPSLAIFSGERDVIQSKFANQEQFAQEVPSLPEILTLFELTTGWVVEVIQPKGKFNSCRNFSRNKTVQDKLVRHSGLIGELRIVDMSPIWPAGRPTAHRAKCDRLIALLNELFTELTDHRSAMQNAKSILAAFEQGLNSPESDEILIDSFIPKYRYETASERDEEFLLVSQPPQEPISPHTGQVQPVDLASLLQANVATKNQTETTEQPSQSSPQKTLFGSMIRWQLGGRRGYHQGRYVDWQIEEDGRIVLALGQTGEVYGYDFDWPKTRQQTKGWESRLIINPASRKFWLTGDRVATFYKLDHRSGEMTTVGAGQHQIDVNQAFIASPSDRLIFNQKKLKLAGAFDNSNANLIAQLLKEALGESLPTIVLNFC